MENQEHKTINTEAEIWKPVVGYEGLYEVSDMGQVRGVNRMKFNGKSLVPMKGRILKPTLNKFGYHIVELSKNGIGTKIFVHRLVGMAFIDNPNNKPFIDHINTKRTDNRAENLRWVTKSENTRNPITIARKKSLTGRLQSPESIAKIKRSQPHSRKVAQISLDGQLIKIWDSVNDAARNNGLRQSEVTQVCTKRRKTTGGYKWKYADGK